MLEEVASIPLARRLFKDLNKLVPLSKLPLFCRAPSLRPNSSWACRQIPSPATPREYLQGAVGQQLSCKEFGPAESKSTKPLTVAGALALPKPRHRAAWQRLMLHSTGYLVRGARKQQKRCLFYETMFAQS